MRESPDVTAEILVADDSTFFRRGLRLQLEAMGHKVEEAEDGFQALERFQMKPPHLVILDLIMTGMFGAEVVARMIQMRPDTLVVIATSDIQDETVDKVRALGAKAILIKPVAQSKLAETVSSVLAGGTMWDPPPPNPV